MAATRTPEPPSTPAAPPGTPPTTPGGWMQRALSGFSSLGDAQFRALWFGLLFSQGAMQINLVVRPWLAYHVSGSSAALGVVAVASGLPMAVFSLVAGTMVDRADKRTLLLAITWLLGALALGTAVLVHLDVVAVWHLAVVGAIQGAAIAFNFPTRSALIPALVPESQLANAIAMNSMGLNLTRVAVPAAAGVLLAWAPPLAFDVITLLYVISALLLLRLPSLRAERRTSTPMRDVIGGLRYVWEAPAVRRLMLLALLPTLLGMPFQQFLPVYQEDVLRVGESALGLMFTAVGVGSLGGSLVVAYLPQRRLGGLQMSGAFAFGIALVGYAYAPNLSIALLALVIVGFTSQGYFVLNNVLLMEATDREFYGRTMGIYMITWSLMPVATLPMGLLIDAYGMRPTQALAGVLLLACVGILLVRRAPGGRDPRRP